MASRSHHPFDAAIGAIRSGDTGALATALVEHPEFVTLQPDDNPRSLLHHATDWPGHWLNVADSIRILVDRGANVEAQFPSDSPGVAETPLHWAASSGDVHAVGALLEAGASVDVLGGIFDGCTPFEEAIIFQKYDAARVLLARGARNYLPGVAALGLSESVEDYFGPDGSVDVVMSVRLHRNDAPDAQEVLDRAFQFACRSGHLGIAKDLLERGADVTATSPANTTALEWAVQNAHHAVARWINTLPSIRQALHR